MSIPERVGNSYAMRAVLALLTTCTVPLTGCELLLISPPTAFYGSLAVLRAFESATKPIGVHYSKFKMDPNASFNNRLDDAMRDIAQLGVLKVDKRSSNHDAPGLVNATLSIDRTTPVEGQENSYEIDVGVDCTDGGLEAYRIRSYTNKFSGKSLMHTQIAGIVRRTKPAPPLDGVVQAICNPLSGGVRVSGSVEAV